MCERQDPDLVARADVDDGEWKSSHDEAAPSLKGGRTELWMLLE
jgi:hypothetical protein